MIRFLISTAIYMAAAAIGLLIASLVLDGVSIDGLSFFMVALVFGVLQAVLSPFFLKVTHRNAQALSGAAGLITTFVALLITDLVSDGLSIEGLSTWFWATLIVWLGTMLAAFVLPLIFVKRQVEERRD
jgi:uncharacterized membrane protein YvlD (DUF360 family)